MRSFKKIAAMFMAVAMLCSFTALGASVTIDDIANIDNQNPTLNITYTATGADDVTVLVYAGESETLAGANVVYIDQITANSDIADITLSTDGPFGTYTVMMGATDLDTAAVKEFTYSDNSPKATVTVADYENGYVAYDASSLEDLAEGTKINFEFTPFLGYKLTSLKIGETEYASSVLNGKWEYTVGNADVTITPVFTAVAADEVNGSVFTSSSVYDLPEDADAALDKEKGKSWLTFGKATDVTGKVAKNMGMYVQVKTGNTGDDDVDYVDFATPKGVGPKYRATSPINNQYGIRFFSFAAGDYRVRSYVEYADATTGELSEAVYGEWAYFTVQ